MSSCVHFKFKSAKDFEAITFAGSFIKLIDLKRAVVEAKSLQKGMDFDLSVVDDHSKEEYTDDNTMVAKNTSVIVKRIPPMRGRPGLLSKIKTLIPVAGQQKTTTPLQPAPAKQLEGGSGQVLSSGSSAPDSPSNPGTMTQEQEANAIAALNVQAGVHRQGFSNMVWTAGGGTKVSDATTGAPRPSSGPPRLPMRKYSGPATLTPPAVSKGVQGAYSGSGTSGSEPPHGYVCKRCNIPGHFIKECPTNGNVTFDTARRKRTLGVPATMLKVVENQAGGGLVDAQGRLVVIQSNKAAFTKLKDQKGGGGSRADIVELLSLSAPLHLKCPLCQKLVTDAVLVPCCQGSACDKCVRDTLAANALQCPLCYRGGVSPDLLMANKSLRAAVDHLILTSTMDSEMKAALEREEAEAREEKARLDDEQAKVDAIETDKKKQHEVTKRAGAKLDLGPDVTAAAETEADEFGGNVYAAAASTTTPEVSTSESPNHVTKPSSSPIDAEGGGGSSTGVETQDILHNEETGDHHQQCVNGTSSPTSEGGGIGGDSNSDANHAATVGGWSGLRKEKEVKESIGSDFSGGGGVDPKHSSEPSHQIMHSMGGPGPYPPGMRRMGAMGPRPPPWVGRGMGPMGQWGGGPAPYMMMRGPGSFMPPWGMGPGPMPRPRGGGNGVWHRGGHHGRGRGSATRPSQQYTGDNTMSPSSGSAGGGEETTAPTKTSGEKGGSSSRLRSRRENVKEGESSSTVEENPNREETEESSTVHETGWGGTDENEVLQTGWGNAYVDSSVSQTGWVNSDELQMSSTTHRSGDNSTAQTEHGGSALQTGLDPVESKYRKQEVKGDADLLGEEAVNVDWPKPEGINTSHHQKVNADDHTYKDSHSHVSRSSKSQYDYSERKRYRGKSRRYGPSGGGSSSVRESSSQERKKRSRNSKDGGERYSNRQLSSSCANGDDRVLPRRQDDGGREHSRRKDDRIRRDHTVKRKSDNADDHTYKDSHVSHSTKSQYDYSERKRYRGESRRDGPSGGGSSSVRESSSQERKKRSRNSKDGGERYSNRQLSSSCANGDDRVPPRRQDDGGREHSRRKDDRIRRGHTVKRESDSSSRSQTHRRYDDFTNGSSQRGGCNQSYNHNRGAPEMKKKSLLKTNRG